MKKGGTVIREWVVKNIPSRGKEMTHKEKNKTERRGLNVRKEKT